MKVEYIETAVKLKEQLDDLKKLYKDIEGICERGVDSLNLRSNKCYGNILSISLYSLDFSVFNSKVAEQIKVVFEEMIADVEDKIKSL